jgi:hypothetical protein
MDEYVFEASLRVIARVRAMDEDTARKAVSSLLSSPGSIQINLANSDKAAVGRPATVTEVDFKRDSFSPSSFSRVKRPR